MVISKRREHRDRSEEILAFIKQYTERERRPPSWREIQVAVGVKSSSTVAYYLNKLISAGKLEKKGFLARGVAIPSGSGTKFSGRNRLIPGLGSIAAGIPIMIPGQGALVEAAPIEVEVPESYIPSEIPSQDVFALRVVGDSMRDAMIQDGDTVLIQKTQDVHNGDIVVAWLVKEETTTLKRIRFTERGRIWLEPENPASAFKKTLFDVDEVDIQGKVLGVLRFYRS
jgi:repressor LexA